MKSKTQTTKMAIPIAGTNALKMLEVYTPLRITHFQPNTTLGTLYVSYKREKKPYAVVQKKHWISLPEELSIL